MLAVEDLSEHTAQGVKITYVRELQDGHWSYYVKLNGHNVKAYPPRVTRDDGKLWYNGVVALFYP